MKRLLKAIIPLSVRQAIRESAKRRQWQGDRYECSFCGAKLKAFSTRGIDSEVIRRLEIVPSGVRDVTCPFCHSYDRDRMLWFFLQRKVDLKSGPIKLLHIAPETTVESKIREFPNIDYISGDLDPELAMVRVDVTAIDFSDETFDAVICNHVLEHVPNDALAMRELLRVTKRGGWAILQVPIGKKLEQTIEEPGLTDEQQRLEKFGQIDHIRVFSHADYVRRLTEAGWNVEEVDMVKELGSEIVERFQLCAKEIMFFCRRSN